MSGVIRRERLHGSAESWIGHEELRLDSGACAALPAAVQASAVVLPGQMAQCLLVLPPGVLVRVRETEWHGAALVEHDQAFDLEQVASQCVYRLRFVALSPARTAGELRVGRCASCCCGLTREAPAHLCPGCRRASCSACSAAKQCLLCGSALRTEWPLSEERNEAACD